MPVGRAAGAVAACGCAGAAAPAVGARRAGAAAAAAAAFGASFPTAGPTRRFFVSTTTDFVRPCEKLCRTVFCSDGRFSDSFGVARWSVFSLGALVYVSLIPLIFLRTRRPHLVSS